MAKNHRYILEPHKGPNTRYNCPGCQKGGKTFSRYIDTETGEHLHPSVGRCNRESNCGYHYKPKQYFHDNNISLEAPGIRPNKPRPITPPDPPKPVSFIPVEVFKASLKALEKNHFVQFLIDVFGVEVTGRLVSRYFIGSSKHWSGATVFWQIDTQGKVRAGKIMLYSPDTGKRIKEPFNHIAWVHKALRQPEFNLRQCLFGEHLLSATENRYQPIAIVESEKTAVIASVYLPQFIWLAVGSLTNLNAEKCSVLKGRRVSLFPDLNGFEKWSSKARELSNLATFQVSDLLERKATQAEREQGLDLADYLLRFDYREFSIPEPATHLPNPTDTYPEQEADLPLEIPPTEAPEPEYYFKEQEQPTSLDWVQCIADLETFFAQSTLPTQEVRLNQWTTITNAHLFIEGHLATVKANRGNSLFLPYLERLQQLQQALNTSSENENENAGIDQRFTGNPQRNSPGRNFTITPNP